MTDESGSDSDGGSSSSSFSSISEQSAKELVKENDQICQEQSHTPAMSSGLDPASVYNPPQALQVRYIGINTVRRESKLSEERIPLDLHF